MKKLIIFLLFSISIQGFSQDIRIFEQIWYLYDLVIDGESNVPPINNEIPYVATNFYENGVFDSGMCEDGFGGTLEYFGTTEFDILTIGFLLGGCYQNEPFNQNYSNLYGGFWSYLSENGLVNYEIIDDGQNRTLIITGPNNDHAIYGNELLSSQDNISKSEFFIYPTLVRNSFKIYTNPNSVIQNITIFNFIGQNILMINNEKSIINVEHLKTGVYFISIIDNNQNITTKKFIKL